MDLESACHVLKGPGVIDEKIIYNAIIEQGPKGEEGRLFKQQGVVYEEITNLRLEFLSILKIDHLWMMTGLTKLHLSNNLIEKIENLDALVNLKELDLSFNFIEKIENLNALLGLEVLTLFQNKIEILENLSHLTNLTVFSIGNNKIADYDSVLYLRGFDSLKSLNMAGNPVCEKENFDKFVVAYLPQLVYYQYHMITTAEREDARETFLQDLIKLEREETAIKELKRAKIEEEKNERINAEAFVEYLGGNKLFKSLFEKDTDCKTLLQIGGNLTEIYNDFEKNVNGASKELLEFGLQQLELRKAETAQYEKYIGDAKEKAFQESRAIVEDFLEQKTTMFTQIKEALNSDVDEEEAVHEISMNVQVINEAFKDLCHRTWTILMKKELNLFEAMEEVNGTYERAMSELVSQFIEGSQAVFIQIRGYQNNFNEAITDITNKFFTNYTVATATGAALSNEYKNLSKELMNLMQEKDILANALSASHDLHLLVIDQREDKLVSGVKNWLSNLVTNLVKSEVARNRASVTEINYFLDIQKANLHELLSTPVGLLLLPKEVQDALQI